MKPLVLGLGNDLMGDDAVGIVAARRLEKDMSDMADIRVSNEYGVALLDYFIGYKTALVIDAVTLDSRSAGELIELDFDDLRPVRGISPHYAGLPDLKALAQSLGLVFPDRVRVLAVQIDRPKTVSAIMSPTIEKSVELLVETAKACIIQWTDESTDHSVAGKVV
jgi:hydrogenase maturation protease